MFINIYIQLYIIISASYYTLIILDNYEQNITILLYLKLEINNHNIHFQ